MRSSIPQLVLLGLLAACGTGGDDEGTSGPALLLGPAGADTFDDLVLTLVDADAAKYDIAWFKDGDVVDVLAGQTTVPASETAKGDDWSVKVTKGKQLSEAALVVGNTAPRAEVSIDPPSPNSSDNIVASGFGVDADGDPTYVEYAWKRNGNSSGFRGAVLDAQSTRRGDVWEVLVTAKDGDDDGPPTVLSFEIVNGLPYVESIGMSTLDAKAPETLRVEPVVVDPDADPVSIEVEWYVSDTLISSGQQRTFSGSFSSGDRVWARVRGNDGRGDGAWSTGPVTMISNTRPTGVVATVAPAPPFAEDDAHEQMDLLCTVAEPATDVDGDTITYHARWFVDGAPFVKTSTTTVPGDTVSWAFTNPGESWTCEMVAEDGNGGVIFAGAALDVGAKSGCVSGASKWVWNLDTMACGSGTEVSWLDATTSPGDYCDTGWELAGADIVNTVLNGTSYTQDETYAFLSEDCSGTWSTAKHSVNRSQKSCTWRQGHYMSLSSEDAMVDGVVCVRE